MKGKTTLAQQVELINALEKEPSKPIRARLLREWLRTYGYEPSMRCRHNTIVRVTGNCESCGVSVAEPIVLGTDESLEQLRARLRG